MQQCTQAGHLCQVHTGYRGREHASSCTDINDVLAAFLIGAGQHSYFGCGAGWHSDSWGHWNAEFDRPLGRPLGPGKKVGRTWMRTFASGTTVRFDAETNIGVISWHEAAANPSEAVVYVSAAAGSDNHTGLTPADAMATIQAGLEAVQRLGAKRLLLDGESKTRNRLHSLPMGCTLFLAPPFLTHRVLLSWSQVSFMSTRPSS